MRYKNTKEIDRLTNGDTDLVIMLLAFFKEIR